MSEFQPAQFPCLKNRHGNFFAHGKPAAPCYTHHHKETQGGVNLENPFNHSHVGGQVRLHRHVSGILRRRDRLHRQPRPVRHSHRPGAGRGHDSVRGRQAGGLLLPGPVPAGLSVRPGLRAAADRPGDAGADPARGGAGLPVHRPGGRRPHRRPLQGADRRGRQTLRRLRLVADSGSGRGRRGRRAGPGVPALGQCPAAHHPAGRGPAGGGHFEPVRGGQYGENRELPAAGCD